MIGQKRAALRRWVSTAARTASATPAAATGHRSRSRMRMMGSPIPTGIRLRANCAPTPSRPARTSQTPETQRLRIRRRTPVQAVHPESAKPMTERAAIT